MSSPIHSYLFSPPPSPPSVPADGKTRAPPLTSLKSLLLPTDLVPRSSIDGNELKSRSPRTPQQSKFTLDSAFPAGLPTRNPGIAITVEDVEGTSTSVPNTPRLVSREKGSSHALSAPSTSIPLPSTLPRPLLRLLFLASLLVTSVLLLIYVPEARLPSLRAASVSRRLALASDGRAYVDVVNPVNSWEEARDRDYVPPQVKAAHMMKRSMPPTESVPAIAPPMTKRPSAKPLPPTHELLALQSYLLQSSYNVLPSTLNPQQPLDANLVLGYEADDEALEELETERHRDITVWYGGDGTIFPPHEVLNLLSSLHGSSRKPTMVPVHGRGDLTLLLDILSRLNVPLDKYPIIMIGNKPLIGDVDELEEMRGSGELSDLLAKIGWLSEGEVEQSQVWKPKLAKIERKEITEVEEALKEVEKRK